MDGLGKSICSIHISMVTVDDSYIHTDLTWQCYLPIGYKCVDKKKTKRWAGGKNKESNVK